MSKRTHITLHERLRRLRDHDRAPTQTPTTERLQQQQPERPSGVYPVVKPQRAWLTMRRSNGNAE
ncbi:MAG TPA: hypothetical protein VMV29_14745 [Ktedonobacterales bacterium]|nr:hypothetical protein [Ktedonobacterales bacterium]